MTAPLWNLEGVCLNPGRLREVALSIKLGITAVMGCSGAGKTSLLNLLVEYERPHSGRISKEIGESKGVPLFWVPPQEGLWPHLTVREHLRAVGIGTNAEVDFLLRKFDLEGLVEALPGRLSQGEQSRLAVVRAIGSGARVLVMDEPFQGIDDVAARRYWKVLSEHCAANGVSLVFASHDPEVVIREAGEVICLARGEVVYAGSVRELYESPASVELARFLGPVNAIIEAESEAWLGRRQERDLFVRPEGLAVEAQEEGACEVEEVRFGGSIEEVLLRSAKGNITGTFYHRPPGPRLSRGMTVTIRLLLMWMVWVFVSGCEQEDGASLKVKENRAWNLTPVKGYLPAPRGTHVASSDELYVLDNAGRVLVYDANRKLNRHWFMPEYEIGKPERLLLLKDGRVAVADTHYGQVMFFDQQGKVLGTIGKIGREDGEFVYPVALAEDEEGNLFVCEYGGNDRVQKFDAQGNFLMKFGKSGVEDGEFQRPSGIVWREGRLYIADAFNNRIQIFDSSGEYVGILGGTEAADLYYPYDIASGPEGDFYIVEYGAGRVTRLSAEGKLVGRYGKSGKGEGEFVTPWGLSVDGRGRIYVTDTGNRRMVELTQ
ncbi:MAG: ATP-binding cassette domain-containing protein [Planctomycetaceae bacterium]|nr:ATP-binding cassette domain-containing protein [Planctomycetaceae bacterium]